MSNLNLNGILKDITPTFEIPVICGHLIFPELPETMKVKAFNIGSELKFTKSLSLIIDQLQFSLYENLIDDFIDTTSIDIKKLTYPDIEWAFFNTRLFTYGNTMTVNVECPDCKSKYDEFYKLYDKYSKDNNADIDISNEFRTLVTKKLKIKESDILRYLSKDTSLYSDEVIVDLTNYSLNIPDNAPFEVYENEYIKLTLIPQTFGAYCNIKKYFVDDRYIQESIKKYMASTTDFAIDDINKTIYQTLLILSSFIYKIEIKSNNTIIEYDDIINNIDAMPFILSKLISKKDISNLQNVIQKLFYTVDINQKHLCTRCGKEITINYWDYPFRFLEFDVNP